MARGMLDKKNNHGADYSMEVQLDSIKEVFRIFSFAIYIGFFSIDSRIQLGIPLAGITFPNHTDA